MHKNYFFFLSSSYRLGPLKVDVSDNNSESGSNNSADLEAAPNTNSRLLQEAGTASGSDVNQNSKQTAGRKPKKFAKKIRSKNSSGEDSSFSDLERLLNHLVKILFTLYISCNKKF